MGLGSPKAIVERVGVASIDDIVGWSEALNDAVASSDLLHIGPADESVFNFTASPSSIGFEGPCIHFDCRLARVDDFVRFVALYADTVAIPNALPSYCGTDAPTPDALEVTRYSFAGDLLVLQRLEDLFEHKIAVFVPDSVELCENHGRLFESTWSQVETALTSAARSAWGELLPMTRVEIRVSEAGVQYSVLYPKGYFEGDQTSLVPVEPPDWLRDTECYKRSLESGEYVDLSPNEIERLGFGEAELLGLLPWARIYLFSSMVTPSKFLTSRPVDSLLLEHALPTEELRYSSRSLSEAIPLRMPMLEGVSASALLRVRESDYEAFLSYRRKIMQVESEYTKRHGVVDAKAARQMYEDIIYPGVESIDAKLKSLRRELATGAMRRIAVVGTVATIGLASGMLPADAADVLKLVSGCGVVDAATKLWKAASIPEEVKGEPFYFLWKVKRVRKHRQRLPSSRPLI